MTISEMLAVPGTPFIILISISVLLLLIAIVIKPGPEDDIMDWHLATRQFDSKQTKADNSLLSDVNVAQWSNHTAQDQAEIVQAAIDGARFGKYDLGSLNIDPETGYLIKSNSAAIRG